jgi:hypothetical protein
MMPQNSHQLPASPLLQVFIHHKDYREVAQFVWPLEHPDSYVIGRYMFEVDKIHTQWAEHIRCVGWHDSVTSCAVTIGNPSRALCKMYMTVQDVLWVD